MSRPGGLSVVEHPIRHLTQSNWHRVTGGAFIAGPVQRIVNWPEIEIITPLRMLEVTKNRLAVTFQRVSTAAMTSALIMFQYLLLLHMAYLPSSTHQGRKWKISTEFSLKSILSPSSQHKMIFWESTSVLRLVSYIVVNDYKIKKEFMFYKHLQWFGQMTPWCFFLFLS